MQNSGRKIKLHKKRRFFYIFHTERNTSPKNGEPGAVRTRDNLIKSQVLYRLSYGLPKSAEMHLVRK
jgi:hypothetical protein